MTETTTKPLILIVDDTPTNIQVLAEALRPDYRVKVAPNGKAAFEVIAKGMPDLILLDVMMPEMDGYEVCRRLKTQPETKEIPVIFITAKSDVLDEELGLRLGAVDYIIKPFNLPIVIARVRNHINLKIKSDLLETMAMVDRLTNIPNRRRFDASLEEEWRRAQRNGTHLSLLMIDIDHFKGYNDHHGHSAGDECLKKVAASLSSVVDRPGDLVARWGGEEFIAILPDTDLDGAKKIAEQMRARVEDMAIPHGHSDISPSVTVSIGVTGQQPQVTDSAAELIEKADHMLYQAKNTGRNRVAG
jgi:diguanylate cyclase (GGDEF)-like protein